MTQHPSSSVRMRIASIALVVTIITTFAVAAVAAVSTVKARRADAAALALRTTYVVNQSASSVTEYAPAANGNAAPVATIAGSHTGLGAPFAAAVDAGGRLYVLNRANASVTEYNPGATGDTAPVATISGPATGLDQPLNLTVDGGGHVFVTDAQTVFEFAPGANGNAVPIARITGSHTALSAPIGVAVDGTGRVYVANFTGAITEYAPGANGDATPVATIAGTNTKLTSPAALTLDSANHVWVSDYFGQAIDEFAAGANGNVAPIATISGTATKLGNVFGVAVDSSGRIDAVDGTDHLVQFAANAKGNVAPAIEVTGLATGLSAPSAVVAAPPLFVTTASLPATTIGASYSATLAAALGTPPYQFSVAFGSLPPGLTINATTGVISGRATAGGVYTFAGVVRDAATPTANLVGRALTIAVGPPRIYVADANSVDEFALGSTGNAAPVNTVHTANIAGGVLPDPVSVDTSGNLWIADAQHNTLAEFAPGAAGDAAPRLALDAIGSGLDEPSAIATDSTGRVYVSNILANSVSEFTPIAGGLVASTLTGPHTGLSAPSGVAIDALGRLLVGASQGTVNTYAAGAHGDATPVATIAGTKTGIDFAASLALDGTGKLYVLSRSQAGSSIRVFAANATGNVAPIAIIAGANTTLLNPVALAVDASGRVYVTNGSSSGTSTSVIEFAPGANGNIAPVATIAGANTGITQASGIAVTPAVFVASSTLPHAHVGAAYSTPLAGALGTPPYTWKVTAGALPNGVTLSSSGTLSGVPSVAGTATFTVTLTDSAVPSNSATRTLTLTTDVQPLVYAASVGNDTVTAYAPGSNGNISPAVALSGSATGLSGPDAVAVDDIGTLYVANDTAAPAGSVTVYAPGASGNHAPARTIAGSNTGIVGPKALALDGDGRLYVASQLAGRVTVYAPGANGNVAPVATISGLGNPNALAFDGVGRLWVADGDAVKVFPAGLTGTVTAPVATLGGSNTGLSGVEGLVFDSTGRLHASNLNAQTITTYAPGATGNVAPIATITGVVNPFAIDVDSTDRLFVARDAGAVWALDSYAPNGVKLASITGPATGLNRPEGVAATPPLSAQTDRLPAGRVGRAYFAQLQAALGTTPYTWSLTKGRLPRGLSLSATGALSGTPVEAGTFKLVLTVRDSSAPALSDEAHVRLCIQRS